MEDSMMRSTGLLRPFNSLRNLNNPRTVLVVATEGSLFIPDDLKTFTEGKNGVTVRFAKSLPLPSGDKHPPIDALAFVYEIANDERYSRLELDLTRLPCLNTIKASLPFVDLRFFVGKCFILAFSDADFDLENTKEIEELATSFHLPIHFVSRQKDPSKPDSRPRLRLPAKLMSIYCPPPGSDVNSLMVDGAVHYGVRRLNGK